MSMISNALITGGAFSQQIDQRQVYTHTQKSAMDRLQEAVAPTAFHNSGERFDPPRCHPNTRIVVREEIEKWVIRTDPSARHAPILWLSGPAGAGKSAIAQTVTEDLHSKGLLVASFFFDRSDSTRNHARLLVATIVYQLYTLLPPAEQSRIMAIIDRDPLIFTRSLLAQFEALIVNPLQPLFDSGLWTRRLIIIDALDECLDRGMQRNVLLMLMASVRQFYAPFVFLLASRPEHDIQAMFGSPDFLPIHTRLFLDDTYFPDHDIELFLRDQFEECRTTHPFRHMIPPEWPSDDIVQKLTSKSSGQFIYASVVTKYLKSSRHRPHHRLDVVLNLRPVSSDPPFSELDTFYTHIFSSVDNIERVLDVISFDIIFKTAASSMEDIESILRLDAGEVAVLLCDLASVIGYHEDPNIGLQLKILHASLVDYLLDSARSKEYFIDVVRRRADRVVDCFRFLSCIRCHDPLNLSAALSAMFCFEEASKDSLDLTEPLYNAIKSFSISRDSAKHAELYQQHQSEYDLFLEENIKACPPESPISLVFALVANYRKLPIGVIHNQFSLFDMPHFDGRALGAFQILVQCTVVEPNLEYLSSFLHDPKRSREFCIGPKLFAQAAKHCLLYLCNHTAFAQKAPPRVSAQQRMRRKHTPWKWHRRALREDIRGPRITPWLWLQRQSSKIYGTCVLHRKTNDLIYIHNPGPYMSIQYNYNRIIKHRVNSEKYHLALIYLNHFLPRASKLGEIFRGKAHELDLTCKSMLHSGDSYYIITYYDSLPGAIGT
ncbi:hypothetical protein D9619_008917 [Psilocybe cf. subviscida]|uniref:Nephrocystin 3-like N-terminal domain-containing protein n=1 Tax=Psilocybe cf. subviscida TaxID=2480587 RepID=A0A8H5FAB7_9AGAR|nr:hypothetical protein D9619_008917 [Psilocybe cf. subviscida]